MVVDWSEQATLKLHDYNVPDGKDRKSQVIRTIFPRVSSVMMDFCEQNANFAQAVAEDGSIDELFDYLCKKIADNGYMAADLDVYKWAAGFYFPTATIDYKMTIDLSGGTTADDSPTAAAETPTAEAATPAPAPKKIELKFDDFF